MFKLFLCLAVVAQITNGANLWKSIQKRQVFDKGDYTLVCEQEPIDFGIVLDSSASINVGSIYNFKKGLSFLQDLFKQFQIGPGPKQVRASIIPFAYGIYPGQSFQLDTYTTKDALLEAVGNIRYKSGGRTDTNLGIDYMRDNLMIPSKTRSYAEKIGIVLTDGDSRNKEATKVAAQKARDAGITMFAVAVGNVNTQELLNIAGDESRVIKVTSYSKLNDVVNTLAKKTCIRKEKPTTTPPPPTVCGEAAPGDVNFVFSPADLGIDDTVWTTEFITSVVESEDMEVGFRFGAVSGSCPADSGFDLQLPPGIDDKLLQYERERMIELIEYTVDHAFSPSHGGRASARDIAVLSITEANGLDLGEDIERLFQAGVEVYVIDPTNSGELAFPHAQLIQGDDPITVAQNFVSAICNPAR